MNKMSTRVDIFEGEMMTKYALRPRKEMPTAGEARGRRLRIRCDLTLTMYHNLSLVQLNFAPKLCFSDTSSLQLCMETGLMSIDLG